MLSLFFLLLAAWAGLGCQTRDDSDDYVARVGEAYLTQEALKAALAALPARQDSAEARRQFVDQWVTNELLYQEATRRNLRTREAIQRRLEESERSVLIDAVITQLFEEEVETLSSAEVLTYYDRNKERLRTREPFLRVLYLSSAEADSVRYARRLLQQGVDTADIDSLWPRLVERFAGDKEGSLTLSGNYFPESQLFMRQPALRQAALQLNVGQTSPLIELEEQTHLIHLADQVPVGTIPELAWIEDHVRRRLTIDARKQMFERQVQRLRTEALSRDALVIR
ncbi:MAG: peptidyl-prolyl cis-trans isomerase [Rhodothermales bacterium]